MASVVTGALGGFIGSGAATKAGQQKAAGYNQAGDQVEAAANNSNLHLADAVNTAVGGYQDAGANAQAGVNTAVTQANSKLDPYVATGASANTDLSGMLGPDGQLAHKFGAADMQADDGYQFRLQQGQQAIQRSAAAHGGAMGGGVMKSLNDYAQGSASQEYQNAFDRYQTQQQNRFSDLNTVAARGAQAGQIQGSNLTSGATYNGNVGMTASQLAGNAEMTGAAGESSNLMAAGKYRGDATKGAADATADGTLGAAAAWTNALGSIGGGIDGFLGGAMSGGGFNWGKGFKNA